MKGWDKMELKINQGVPILTLNKIEFKSKELRTDNRFILQRKSVQQEEILHTEILYWSTQIQIEQKKSILQYSIT